MRFTISFSQNAKFSFQNTDIHYLFTVLAHECSPEKFLDSVFITVSNLNPQFTLTCTVLEFFLTQNKYNIGLFLDALFRIFKRRKTFRQFNELINKRILDFFSECIGLEDPNYGHLADFKMDYLENFYFVLEEKFPDHLDKLLLNQQNKGEQRNILYYLENHGFDYPLKRETYDYDKLKLCQKFVMQPRFSDALSVKVSEILESSIMMEILNKCALRDFEQPDVYHGLRTLDNKQLLQMARQYANPDQSKDDHGDEDENMLFDMQQILEHFTQLDITKIFGDFLSPHNKHHGVQTPDSNKLKYSGQSNLGSLEKKIGGFSLDQQNLSPSGQNAVNRQSKFQFSDAPPEIISVADNTQSNFYGYSQNYARASAYSQYNPHSMNQHDPMTYMIESEVEGPGRMTQTGHLSEVLSRNHRQEFEEATRQRSLELPSLLQLQAEVESMNACFEKEFKKKDLSNLELFYFLKTTYDDTLYRKEMDFTFSEEGIANEHFFHRRVQALKKIGDKEVQDKDKNFQEHLTRSKQKQQSNRITVEELIQNKKNGENSQVSSNLGGSLSNLTQSEEFKANNQGIFDIGDTQRRQQTNTQVFVQGAAKTGTDKKKSARKRKSPNPNPSRRPKVKSHLKVEQKTENFVVDTKKVVSIDKESKAISLSEHLMFTRFWYVKHRFRKMTEAELFQMPSMIQNAFDCYQHIQKVFSQEMYTYTDSPFTNENDYRLMNFSHRYLGCKSTKKMRDIQHRFWQQSFNDNYQFKTSLREDPSSNHYLDNLMWLLNTLCDGPIFMERRSFCMLLCAMLKTKAELIIDELFFNPYKFPLVQILNWLVFDELVRPYNTKLIANINYQDSDFHRLASFIELYIKNKRSFSQILRGRGSIIVEFLYKEYDPLPPGTNLLVPRSYFAVIRENTDFKLSFLHPRMKSPDTMPVLLESDTDFAKEIYSTILTEIIDDPSFYVHMKYVFEIRFYACELATEIPKTFLNQYDDFHYQARSFLIRLFSMYSMGSFKYLVGDLKKSVKYLHYQVEKLTYENASDDDTLDQLEPPMKEHFRTPRANYLKQEYIQRLITRYKGQTLNSFSPNLQSDFQNQQLHLINHGLRHRPFIVEQTLYQMAELQKELKLQLNNSAPTAYGHQNLVDRFKFIKALCEHYTELIKQNFNHLYQFFQTRFVPFHVPEQNNSTEFKLNYQVPEDINQLMGVVQCLKVDFNAKEVPTNFLYRLARDVNDPDYFDVQPPTRTNTLALKKQEDINFEIQDHPHLIYILELRSRFIVTPATGIPIDKRCLQFSFDLYGFMQNCKLRNVPLPPIFQSSMNVANIRHTITESQRQVAEDLVEAGHPLFYEDVQMGDDHRSQYSDYNPSLLNQSHVSQQSNYLKRNYSNFQQEHQPSQGYHNSSGKKRHFKDDYKFSQKNQKNYFSGASQAPTYNHPQKNQNWQLKHQGFQIQRGQYQQSNQTSAQKGQYAQANTWGSSGYQRPYTQQYRNTTSFSHMNMQSQTYNNQQPQIIQQLPPLPQITEEQKNSGEQQLQNQQMVEQIQVKQSSSQAQQQNAQNLPTGREYTSVSEILSQGHRDTQNPTNPNVNFHNNAIDQTATFNNAYSQNQNQEIANITASQRGQIFNDPNLLSHIQQTARSNNYNSQTLQQQDQQRQMLQLQQHSTGGDFYTGLFTNNPNPAQNNQASFATSQQFNQTSNQSRRQTQTTLQRPGIPQNLQSKLDIYAFSQSDHKNLIEETQKRMDQGEFTKQDKPNKAGNSMNQSKGAQPRDKSLINPLLQQEQEEDSLIEGDEGLGYDDSIQTQTNNRTLLNQPGQMQPSSNFGGAQQLDSIIREQNTDQLFIQEPGQQERSKTQGQGQNTGDQVTNSVQNFVLLKTESKSQSRLSRASANQQITDSTRGNPPQHVYVDSGSEEGEYQEEENAQSASNQRENTNQSNRNRALIEEENKRQIINEDSIEIDQEEEEEEEDEEGTLEEVSRDAQHSNTTSNNMTTAATEMNQRNQGPTQGNAVIKKNKQALLDKFNFSQDQSRQMLGQQRQQSNTTNTAAQAQQISKKKTVMRTQQQKSSGSNTGPGQSAGGQVQTQTQQISPMNQANLSRMGQQSSGNLQSSSQRNAVSPPPNRSGGKTLQSSLDKTNSSAKDKQNNSSSGTKGKGGKKPGK